MTKIKQSATILIEIVDDMGKSGVMKVPIDLSKHKQITRDIKNYLNKRISQLSHEHQG